MSDQLVPISIRLYKSDIDATKREASCLGMPYQVLIRSWVAEKVRRPRRRKRKKP